MNKDKATGNPSTYYGRDCKHKHGGERYWKGNGCVQCVKEAAKRRKQREYEKWLRDTEEPEDQRRC